MALWLGIPSIVGGFLGGFFGRNFPAGLLIAVAGVLGAAGGRGDTVGTWGKGLAGLDQCVAEDFDEVAGAAVGSVFDLLTAGDAHDGNFPIFVL